MSQKDIIYVNPDGYLPTLDLYYSGNGKIVKSNIDGDVPVDSENVQEHLAFVKGADKAWIISINDYLWDQEDNIESWISNYFDLQESETIMVDHVRLRVFGNCSWE